METLQEIFNSIRSMMAEYQPPFVARMDDPSHFDLWSEKQVVIAGRKRNDVYYAGLIIQKSYVGFYYMPVYANTELKEVFHPDLLKLLKGKSCFHIKKLDPQLMDQIRSALKIGFEQYQKSGWV
ncbi:MAG: DUF1801 domain-containing protein [Anaerolineaceae bacterium]|nr:DUF1801 domain-containing protein [Anaerolineaceae bacterium]